MSFWNPTFLNHIFLQLKNQVFNQILITKHYIARFLIQKHLKDW